MFRLVNPYYYAVFIIDVYSRQIVGYQVSDHMRAEANIKALKMALKSHPAPDIHHSDRGTQYTSKGYLNMLKEYGVQISMALSAQDNAYAERINKTIKEEYLDYWRPGNYQELKQCVKRAVTNYNSKRLHKSLDRMTPMSVAGLYHDLPHAERKSFTIFDNSYL
jgi:putative transposase